MRRLWSGRDVARVHDVNLRGLDQGAVDRAQQHRSQDLVITSIQARRKAFAKAIVRSAGSTNPRLVDAFASTPRELFLGPAPWPIFAGHGRRPTWSSDPAQVYQDALVGLAIDRGINNGQPSLHARCLAGCAPQPGESVLHIGAGMGYYTAILAALVGPTGSVLAYEIEADLADRARQQLQARPRVRVVAASAVDAVLPGVDIIYVNAGVSHLPGTWLDALNPGGRMVVPLTPNRGPGVMLMITRRGPASWAATVLGCVVFVDCVGARDDLTAEALTRAISLQPIDSVRSLRRHTPPDHTVWCAGKDWWLSTAEPD